jgi:6-phosphogluconolactonase
VNVTVCPDAASLAATAADHVAAALRAALSARDRATVAFSGGSTPGPMLAELATRSLRWGHVHVFQVDERIAPDGHPDRNLGLLRDALSAALPAAQLHAMPVAGDPDADAADYAATLAGVCGTPPVVDLVHLGLGADGHTASLVPGDPVLEVTDADVAVTGTYQSRRRLTLTAPALRRARQRLWLVAGADKATAVRRLLDGDPAIPAALVAGDDDQLLLDPAAAGQLG